MLQSEFSRIIDLLPISDEQTWTFVALPHECQALCSRLGLLDMQSLIVHATVTCQSKGETYKISVTVDAEVRQPCAATLEPVTARVEHSFQISVGGEEPIEPDDDDWEPLPAEGLDLGEIAVQYLSLMLDPYIRIGTLAEKDSDALDAAAELSPSEHLGRGQTPFADLAERIGRPKKNS